MRRRVIAGLLIVLCGLVVLAALVYWRFTAAVASPDAASLPPSLAGRPLIQSTYGPQAVAEVNRLHGLDFPLSSGAMGIYGAEGQAVLWVSGAPAQPMAARMVAAMRDRIAEGNSPFTPTAQRLDGRRVAYELDGMGLKHVYFQSGTLVVWLAADPLLAERAVPEALEFYP